ncbi:helix-turn-helix transcriptional regulator [Modestobacter muralis]|uniref:Helix-turn-helix transcriptional regulator n=1 Tax=Modestobacter muralis TaxID=1608614 RepID=A0A6P0ER94_9ACTN|nr:helix-turn-helix domain-containing protein [Modestobacter muralis]NEK93627.1 helix-turn-helix transcriptional regulator [Modestobacter muralis]NEN50394.1 helix-turn-helix transcriptional regulator [Modestobacter muralis]
MGRWEADAGGRLQYAAMSLYFERGYDAVTVAEIAERAGLTKRTFFRHYADKREVLFAGAPAFQAGVVAAVAAAPVDQAPVDTVIAALAETGGAQLAQYGEWARARRDLVESSADLRERALIKSADLAAAVAAALRERGVAPGQATLTAHAAVTAFTVGYDRWADGNGVGDLPTAVRETLADLRTALTPG